MMQCNTQLNKHLFLALAGTKASKLSEIPDVIQIQKNDKILFGAILFIHPVLEGDTGRYLASIKVNENWITFDDMKTQPRFVSKN